MILHVFPKWSRHEGLQRELHLYCKRGWQQVWHNGSLRRGDMPPPAQGGHASTCSHVGEGSLHTSSEIAVANADRRRRRRISYIIPAACLARHPCCASMSLTLRVAMEPLASVLRLHLHAHLLARASYSGQPLLCYASAPLSCYPCATACPPATACRLAKACS